MIYITSDTHGNSNLERFFEAQKLADIKYLIVTGDFGYVYFGTKSEEETLDILNNLGYKILFVDGNHEGFNLLNSYKEIEWSGGKVHQIRDNILHLKRGEIFNIEGKTFFTFGGAKSVDMLEKIAVDEWFEEEMPTKEEMDYGISNLENHNYKVDYILTHSCDTDSLIEILPYAEVDSLNRFFTFIKNNTSYNCWYFGHLHWDYNVDNKHKCIYQRIERL